MRQLAACQPQLVAQRGNAAALEEAWQVRRSFLRARKLMQSAAVFHENWIRLRGASWRVTIPVAIVATLVIHFSFYKLLRVPLPWGVLEGWAF